MSDPTETDTPKDSLGQLPNSKTTSSENSQTSTPPSAPVRTEYRKAGRAGVLRVILFMSDIKGEPWGKGDEEAAIRFKDGWTMLIGDLPEKLLMEAAAEFCKQPGRKWPTPGDLRDHVKKLMPATELPARHQHDVVYDYSKLPPHVIEHRASRRLAAMGCAPEFIEWRARDRKLTREAVDKVNAMSPEQLRKLGLDDRSIQRARKALSSASDDGEIDLRKPSQQDVPESTTSEDTAIDSQSPPTASERFDDAEHG